MYYLSDLCCTCLKKTDELINLTNKDSDGLSFANKFKMCAFDFIFHNLMENQPLFICESCCDNLKFTYNFRKRSMKNSRTFRGYISQLTNVTEELPNSYFDVNIEISNNDTQKCFHSKKLLNRGSSSTSRENNNSLLNSMNRMKTERDNQITSRVNDNSKVDLHTFEDSDLLQNIDDSNVSSAQLSVSSITNNNNNTVGLQESPDSSDDEHSVHSNDRLFEEFMTQLRIWREDNSKTARNIDSSVDSPETFSSTVDDFDEQLANFDFETFSEMQQNTNKSETRKDNVTDNISKPAPPTYGSFKHYSNSGVSSKTTKYPNSGASSKTTKSPKKKYFQYCKICDKYLAGNFQRHLLIHSGKKPYKCQECGSAFIRSDYLKSHINRFHLNNERMNVKNPVIYKCFECGQTSNSKKIMTNHIRTLACLRAKRMQTHY